MSDIHLIDTSMWINALRKAGDAASRQRVQNLMRSGKAAWCDAVRLELWRGTGSNKDRELLRNLEREVISLPIDHKTWNFACQIASAGRQKGLQFPSLDLIIFACAKQHGTELLARDKHFDQLIEISKDLPGH